MLQVSGDKKSLGGSSPVEQPNTLRANTLVKMIELISSGEIVGLIAHDGTPVNDTTICQAVYLNETPVQNSDGTLNFQGVSAQQRVGLPDQDYLTGFNAAENPITVETQIKISNGPVIRTITDTTIDAVRVIVRIPALSWLDTDTGSLNGNSVEYAIDVRSSGGSYNQVELVSILGQKCVSPYPRASLIQLPAGGAPWDIRIRRITADSLTVNLQNETWWESYTEIVQGKFIYPNRALVGVLIDAQQFGTSIPTRAYRVRGLKTDIPSNYDPIARTYTGIWDGTFVKGWHNNGAWVFWDLLTNNRYGLGEFVPPALADKWSLYQIAQYCDGLVPSGLKDEFDADILEPRFSFNGVINNRQEAFKLLQDVSAAFRGMAYWSLGQAFVSVDRPTDPIVHVTPANVIDGHFKYSGTALKARHSVAMVGWNDPNDFYKPSMDIVRHDGAFKRFGWRQVDVHPIGCISRGQAVRYGKWILETENSETETVEFTMSFDGFVLQNGGTLKPGDIILVHDPRKNGGIRSGGRLQAVTDTSHIVLDFPFVTAIETYKIRVLMPNGTVETKDVSAFSGTGNVNVALTTPFSMLPHVGASWGIEGSSLAPRQYRVLAVRETAKNLFQITGLFHDPNKFARIEQGLVLDAPTYTRPRNSIKQPSNPNAVESTYFQGGVAHSRVTLSWTQADDFQAVLYSVTADTPHGFLDFGRVNVPTIDIEDATPGSWTFYITSVSRSGLSSLPTTYTFSVGGWEAVTAPTVTNVQVLGGGSTFTGTGVTLTWTNHFPTDAVVFAPENVIRVYSQPANVLLRTVVVKQPTYTYSLDDNINDGGPRRSLRFDITVKSVANVESTPASFVADNPVPGAISPTLQASTSMIHVFWSSNATDIAGAQVWVSAVDGFTPGPGNLVYDGPDTSIAVPVDHGIYYVRVALYDTFGKTGLNLSSQQSISINNVHDNIEAFVPELDAFISSALSEATNLTITSADDLAEQIISLADQIIKGRDDLTGQIERHRQEVAVAASNASARVTQEESARIDGDLAEASLRTALQTTVNANTAAITQEISARSTAVSAEATARLALGVQVSSNAAAIITESQARADADTAEATARTTLAATVATNTAAITTESKARADADVAEASARVTLASQVVIHTANIASNTTSVVTNQAAIITESSTRATADTAEATARSTLAAQVTVNTTDIATGAASILTNSSAIANEATVRASADSAEASTRTALSTTVGGHTATLGILSSSINGVSVQFGVVGTIDGVTGGFNFTGVKQLDGSVSYGLEIDANVIIDGTVTARTLAANSVTAGKISAGAINASSIVANDVIVTGHLQADSVTKLDVVQNSLVTITEDGTTVDLASLTLTVPTSGSTTLIVVSIDMETFWQSGAYYSSISILDLVYIMTIDGLTVRTILVPAQAASPTAVIGGTPVVQVRTNGHFEASLLVSLFAGSHTIKLRMTPPDLVSHGGGTFDVKFPTVTVFQRFR